jgi:acetyl-CoA carboxylase biotin carboxylase subunit
LRQCDVELRGAAIEARINAEDPARDFRPTPGRLDRFVPPGGPFIRVDSHAQPGTVIPPDYDPMIGKISVWAPDRDQAIARLDRALSECVVSGRGVRTTTEFLRDVLAHPLFRDARHTTRLVETMLAPEAMAEAG